MDRVSIVSNFTVLILQLSIHLLVVSSLVILKQARHHKRVLVPEESKFHSVWPMVWLYKMGYSCKGVFPNTCALEQQDSNKTMKQRKKVRRGK